jgi:peptidoglycan/xylan/chitin deacetylase (PgdA/CDA1 family)
MQDYGRTDKERLGIDYWKKMEERIDKYGPAKRIINFELHGDNYSFYDGGYSMNPEAFKRQMTYLCQEDYHFVTAPELLGFLEGWIELPARSVILTTDSSNRSVNSLARIMEDFSSLQGSYETYPHVLSFIWTLDMTPQEKAWDTFRQALESGHFSIGTHTESHKDFRQMSPEMGIADLRQSKQKIKNKLGINVYGISWPFEGCPSYREELEAEGFKFAFGGRSRGLAECYTYKNDSLRLCLPRVFPPNPNGVSGRPNGKTLEEMLSDMISEAN